VGVVVNLFIFNFKKLSGLFIIFFVMFFIYNVFLYSVAPKITMYQNQWQKNYAFAQDFIYNESLDKIIVGSSMSARMENSFFDNKISNLSFTGGSVLTGLEIIKRKEIRVKTIYIETNVIFREKDKKLVSTIFSPVLWKMKKKIPALQEKYQPLNIVLTQLKGSYGKTHAMRMKENIDAKVFNVGYKEEEKRYNAKSINYENSLHELKNLINYFEKNGTRIIFFEMPIDVRLAQSIRAKQEREIIVNNFHNPWFKKPKNSVYSTSDGIHLLYKSAYKYSQVFMQEAEKKRSKVL